MAEPVILATIPGSSDHDRLLLVLSTEPGGGISLLQQTFGPGVGWYTQKSLAIAPEQVQQLRLALGGAARSAPAMAVTSFKLGQQGIGEVDCTASEEPAILSLDAYRPQAESA